LKKLATKKKKKKANYKKRMWVGDVGKMSLLMEKSPGGKLEVLIDC
jgi:hypothetical protein